MHKPINFCQMLKFYYYYFSLVTEWTSLISFSLYIWQVILTINLNLSSYRSSYKFFYFEGRLSKQWKIIFLNMILVVCERNVFIVTEWYGNSNCSSEVYDSHRLEFAGTSSPTRCKSRKHSMFLTVQGLQNIEWHHHWTGWNKQTRNVFLAEYIHSRNHAKQYSGCQKCKLV